ncbi:MAG: hypothetical protein AAGH88_14910 [Planctomycetota bacterium]
MSRLPAPLYNPPTENTQPRAWRRSAGRKCVGRTAGQPGHSNQLHGLLASPVWFVFLVGLIVGAAVLATYVNNFLYG